MDETRCGKQVQSDGMGFHYHQCQRKGVVEHEGKWYCKQHDPKEVARRREAQTKKWNAEWAAKQARWKREEARASAYPLMLNLLLDFRAGQSPEQRKADLASVIELAQRGVDP